MSLKKSTPTVVNEHRMFRHNHVHLLRMPSGEELSNIVPVMISPLKGRNTRRRNLTAIGWHISNMQKESTENGRKGTNH